LGELALAPYQARTAPLFHPRGTHSILPGVET
jgi:hypothetical protein